MSRSRQGRLGATPRILVSAASDPLGLPRRRRRKPPGEVLAVDGGGGAFPRISPGSLGGRPRRDSAACSRTSLPGGGGACGLPCRRRISACRSGAWRAVVVAWRTAGCWARRLEVEPAASSLPWPDDGGASVRLRWAGGSGTVLASGSGVRRSPLR
jgi:hypothetical protein